jgi:hypothetical protein
MKILERLRNRSSHREAGAPGSPEASSADEQRLPIARYDQVDGKQLIAQLSQLSQVELATVEAHERSHRDRPAVLNRLRWLRGNEPLPGYDALASDEIVRILADADAATAKAVRSHDATTATAARCEQKSHTSSPPHRPVLDRIAPANRRPRSSKQASGRSARHPKGRRPPAGAEDQDSFQPLRPRGRSARRAKRARAAA